MFVLNDFGSFIGHLGVPVVASGLPGFPGVVGGAWLVIAFAGLTLGTSTITR